MGLIYIVGTETNLGRRYLWKIMEAFRKKRKYAVTTKRTSILQVVQHRVSLPPPVLHYGELNVATAQAHKLTSTGGPQFDG